MNSIRDEWRTDDEAVRLGWDGAGDALTWMTQEIERLRAKIDSIRERAAVFAKPNADNLLKRSAAAACSWIVSEIDG